MKQHYEAAAHVLEGRAELLRGEAAYFRAQEDLLGPALAVIVAKTIEGAAVFLDDAAENLRAAE